MKEIRDLKDAVVVARSSDCKFLLVGSTSFLTLQPRVE